MRSFLPGHRIREMEAPAQILGHRRLPDSQGDLRNVYSRSANSQATGAVLCCWRNGVCTEEKVRKAEIIDQRRAENAGEAQYALVHPRQLASPTRRIRTCLLAGGYESPVAIMREPEECGMCV